METQKTTQFTDICKEQRTNEWFLARSGRFTASEIHKLMGVRGLGETGKSYAIDKAIEQFYGGQVDDNFTSYDMERGKNTEPLAFNKFSELMGLKFVEVDKCGFFSLTDIAGASPDGLVGSDAVLEIKCPKNSTFFKLVATNEIDQKYLYQMQLQMICTGRNLAYFFNYIIIDGVEFHHTIEVPRDHDICDKMITRIAEAKQIKDEYINKLNQNKQWN